LFVVDSRDRLINFHGMVLKPNDLEAAQLLFPGRGAGAVSLEDLAQAGLERQHETDRPLFITLGRQGCLVIAPGKASLVPAVPVPPPLDTVGAGDTFLSALSAGLAAGASALQAAALANLAAAVSVRKLRITGTASPDEILTVYDTFVKD
jgi:sugar/nucleoside kinase (ribokinase family)